MKKVSRKQYILRETKNLIGITIGSLLVAIGYAWFLMPYNMSPGGVAGIAQIMNYYLKIPYGLSMIILNVPLFIISFIFIGKAFGAKSIYGMLISSLFTDLVNIKNLARLGLMELSNHTFLFHGRTIYAYLPPNDLLLSAITGSVILGLGLGLIFRFRGSTGGTDIPVALIKQKAGLSIGTGYYLVESVIILFVFVAAIMEGIAARFLAMPKIAIGLTLIAVVTFVAIFCITTLIFAFYDRKKAFALGFMSSQRNMGLMLAATAGALPDIVWLYFAISQFPIYLSPKIFQWVEKHIPVRMKR